MEGERREGGMEGGRGEGGVGLRASAHWPTTVKSDHTTVCTHIYTQVQ